MSLWAHSGLWMDVTKLGDASLQAHNGPLQDGWSCIDVAAGAQWSVDECHQLGGRRRFLPGLLWGLVQPRQHPHCSPRLHRVV
eukprot:scaffold155389_cov21-Tisochrysis_lutea.AAC.1